MTEGHRPLFAIRPYLSVICIGIILRHILMQNDLYCFQNAKKRSSAYELPECACNSSYHARRT